MTDLYLHIGTEKTGTTSIQRFCKTNRAVLADAGFLYPFAPGKVNHAGLTVAALDDKKMGPLRRIYDVRTPEDVLTYREKMTRDLGQELKERPYKTAIVSNEHCSSRLLRDREAERLRDLLAPFFSRIFVVVYIRRQDDFLLSTYSTKIKSGKTKSLVVPTGGLNMRYDHWELISRWERAFGRESMIVRKFERASLKNGDVVADFLAAAGVPEDLPFAQPEMANESLDANTLEFLRLFNKQVPRFVDKDLNAIRGNLVPLLSAISKGALPTVSEDELRTFMAHFTESNRKVAEEYFGGTLEGSDDPLFQPRSDKRDRTTEPDLTAERAVEISAFLWQQKQEEIDRLSERLERQSDRLMKAKGGKEGKGGGGGGGGGGGRKEGARARRAKLGRQQRGRELAS